MNKEKLIEEIMKECEKEGEPITRAEAEEMAEMELKAQGIPHYEKSDKPRKVSQKERKVNTVKKRILTDCRVLIEGLGAKITETINERELVFFFEGKSYSLKLIEHNRKKDENKG